MSNACKKPRGFAAMSPERRAELGRRGGRKTQALGLAPLLTSETAREIGAKAKNPHRFTSEKAREAAREGWRQRREAEKRAAEDAEADDAE